MNRNWNDTLLSRIKKHREQLINGPPSASDEVRRVARATNGLPVYSDLSGSLALATDGKVLFRDSESGAVEEVKDEKWTTVALVAAAEKYPDLRDLLPERPPLAIT